MRSGSCLRCCRMVRLLPWLMSWSNLLIVSRGLGEDQVCDVADPIGVVPDLGNRHQMIPLTELAASM